MYQVVVCDDDHSITDKILLQLVQKYGKRINCTSMYSASEVRQWIANNQIDIIILDIKLGEEDGIALAKELKQECPQMMIILLSGFAQLASSVYDADPVYFLSKPINEDRLFGAVDRAMQMLETQEVKAITVTAAGGKIYRIKLEEVLYVETCNRNCMVHFDDGSSVEVVAKLSELAKKMPDYMITTHQSFMCNMNKIKSFSKEEGIFLLNDVNVPVSRRHYKNVKQQIGLHI